MKKKFFIGIAMSLFAVATVFNMNLLNENGASDISLDAIAVMAQASDEFTSDGTEWDTDYHLFNDLPFTSKWKPKREQCSGTKKQETTTKEYNVSSNATVGIPNTPVNVSGGYSVTYKKTTTSTYSEPIVEYRVTCVTGNGNCWNGHGCSRG